MRLVYLISLLTLYSCLDSTKHPKSGDSLKDNTLKPYQQYCLDFLRRAVDKNGGYQVSDSLYLWSDGYFNNGWKTFYITRTIYDGSYTYLFWKKENDSFALYREAIEPIVSFERDALYDVNGDGYKDLLIIDNSMNGQCQPQFPILYCFEIGNEEFIEIKDVKKLPNPVFDSKERTISGEWECKMTKDVYKLKWTERFKLDTIYYKSLKL